MGLGVKSVGVEVDVSLLFRAMSSTSRSGVSVGCSSSADS